MNTRSLSTPYRPGSGHADTLFTKLLQGKVSDYHRKLLPDSTGKTQVAYDFANNVNPDAPLVVLFHGLEGSNESHCAAELVKTVQQCSWNSVVARLRSCDGITNTTPVFYHLSDTPGIVFMLNMLARRCSAVYAAGASLGGSVLVKYLGEQGSNAVPHTSAVVSALVDIVVADTRFDQGMTQLTYMRYLLNSLLPKARATPQFQTVLSRQDCKMLGDSDDRFTAPFHGFTDHHDYYCRNSCKPSLKGVDTPLLLLNAVNDPFLPPEVLSTGRDVSSAATLLQPTHGGHVGFVGRGRGRLNLRQLPQTMLDYFGQYQL